MTAEKPRRSIEKIRLRGELRQKQAQSFEQFVEINQWERREPPTKRGKNFVEKAPNKTELNAALRPYAEAIGHSTVQWNNLQQWLSIFFWTIFDKNDEEAVAVWNTVSSDRTQRQMLKAAAKIKFIVRSHHPSVPNAQAERAYAIYDHLEFICTVAEKFEDLRNNATHSPIKIGISADCFHVYLDDENFRAQAFKEKILASHLSILDELAYLHTSLSTLNAFASKFWHAWIKNEALPEKPRMPHRAPRRRQSQSHRKNEPK